MEKKRMREDMRKDQDEEWASSEPKTDERGIAKFEERNKCEKHNQVDKTTIYGREKRKGQNRNTEACGQRRNEEKRNEKQGEGEERKEGRGVEENTKRGPRRHTAGRAFTTVRVRGEPTVDSEAQTAA